MVDYIHVAFGIGNGHTSVLKAVDNDMAGEIAGSLGLYSLQGTIGKAGEHCYEHKAHSNGQGHKGISSALEEQVPEGKEEHD